MSAFTDEVDIEFDEEASRAAYKAKLKALAFGFRGPTGGRSRFHDETIAGVQRETVEGARAQGREVRPKTKVNYA